MVIESQARHAIVSAGIALFVGSLAAPTIYVIEGLLFPQGFHNFRSASILTIAEYFGTALLVSALLTLIVGGSFWKLLHERARDGVIAYSILAVIATLVLGLVAQTTPSWQMILLATGNAVLVRLAEIVVARTRPRTRSNSQM